MGNSNKIGILTIVEKQCEIKKRKCISFPDKWTVKLHRENLQNLKYSEEIDKKRTSKIMAEYVFSFCFDPSQFVELGI